MKAKEVLKLLNITRPTLCSYVKKQYIKVHELPSGIYEYDDESVFKLKNKNITRHSVIYARVSTNKQKQDLENQVTTLTEFCLKNGIPIGNVYKDIGSGINFDRKNFQLLINDIMDYKIDKIFITYSDRLSRISFPLFQNIFKKYGTQIIVLNQINDEKLIEKEIFSEIINLIHCFSMKVYSSRRKEKLKLVKKDLELENDSHL
jgi:predicted site-specific integrase-resolvase